MLGMAGTQPLARLPFVPPSPQTVLSQIRIPCAAESGIFARAQEGVSCLFHQTGKSSRVLRSPKPSTALPPQILTPSSGIGFWSGAKREQINE